MLNNLFLKIEKKILFNHFSNNEVISNNNLRCYIIHHCIQFINNIICLLKNERHALLTIF